MGADPYKGMSDEQVLAIAQAAHRRAVALPAASGARRAQWKAFDKAMGELVRRAMADVLRKIHERGINPADDEDVKIAEAIVELTERDNEAGEP